MDRYNRLFCRLLDAAHKLDSLRAVRLGVQWERWWACKVNGVPFIELI
jgi:hypothetical protein